MIVGGVGIITTLYTSVIERILENATQAIGTEGKHILFLFLVEALLIKAHRSYAGPCRRFRRRVVSINLSPGNGPPLIPVYHASEMTTVWIISVSLSVIAGLFPAWKASRTLPIVVSGGQNSIIVCSAIPYANHFQNFVVTKKQDKISSGYIITLLDFLTCII